MPAESTGKLRNVPPLEPKCSRRRTFYPLSLSTEDVLSLNCNTRAQNFVLIMAENDTVNIFVCCYAGFITCF